MKIVEEDSVELDPCPLEGGITSSPAVEFNTPEMPTEDLEISLNNVNLEVKTAEDLEMSLCNVKMDPVEGKNLSDINEMNMEENEKLIKTV